MTLGPNPGYLLRFEADGYASSVSRLIAPEEGEVYLDVTLQPATERRVAVLNPDGSPAAWTDMGLLDLTKGNSLGLLPGGLAREERTDGALQQTDAEGMVRLLSDGTLHQVVAANQAGYVETNLDRVPDGGSIRLQPWGRISGVLPESQRTSSNQVVWIDFVHQPPRTLMAGISFCVQPDENGKFTLPQVPPGRLDLFVGTKSTEPNGLSTWSSGRPVQIEVRPGETTQVAFEGETARRPSRSSEQELN